MPFTMIIDKSTTFEEAKIEVENRIHQAACAVFEDLEGSGLIAGNGHHMAQNLAAQAVEEVRRRWRDQTDDTIPIG
jgi:hypothetical protein